MNRKNKIKAIVALAVALAFIMPGAAAFANDETTKFDTTTITTDGNAALTGPVHNLNTGLNYTTIQGAIDATETLDGHTIYVDNGVYYEYLTVDKSINLVGESKEETIIDGNGGTTKILYVIVDNVNVSSFTIRNGNYGPYFGNNFVNNGINDAYHTGGGYTAIWDNGYPSGGNYYSDYIGEDILSGPNQDAPGSDGIGDTAYEIPGDDFHNNWDNYPLMNPWTPPPPTVTLAVTKSGTGSGTVEYSPSGPFYYGDVVTLWANASVGSTFTGWSGDLSGSTTPDTLNMTKNMDVTATFTEDEYTLDITIAGGGNVTKYPDQPTYTYGTVVELNATADYGWEFDSWTSNVANPDSATTTITMNSNKAVTATFTSLGWKSLMNFTGDVLEADTVVFGESTSASDGIDPMDLVKPDAPPAPYIYAYLERTDLPDPYDILWEEYRFYDALNGLQVWDLVVETDNDDGTVDVTIAWDKVALGATQYDDIGLYDMLSGDLLKDMKTNGMYMFTAVSGMANRFQIICTSNHAPVANDDYYSTYEAHELNVAVPGVLGNDVDEDGDPLEVKSGSLVYDFLNGYVELYTEGSFVYTPNVGYSGTDSFTYKAYDGALESNIAATVYIEVLKLNHIDLQHGWNLISMPVGESIDKKDILVRYNNVDYNWTAACDAIIEGPTFGWNAGVGYTIESILVPGEGYWMWSHTDDCELLIPSNVEAGNHIKNLDVEWNLVGIPYGTSLEKIDIKVYFDGVFYTWDAAVDKGIILDHVFGWDRTNQSYYVLTDTFRPGYGYWMYAYHGCELYLWK